MTFGNLKFSFTKASSSLENFPIICRCWILIVKVNIYFVENLSCKYKKLDIICNTSIPFEEPNFDLERPRDLIYKG
jgi:hypothetical protein